MSKDKDNMNEFDDIGPLPDEKQPEGLDNAPRSPFERPTFNRGERGGFGASRGERPARFGGDRPQGGGFGDRPARNDRPAFGGRSFGNDRGDRGDRPAFGGGGGRGFQDRGPSSGGFAGRGSREGGGREGGRTMPIDADLLDVFPDPRAVNQALRALAGIIRGSRGGDRPPRRDFGGDRGSRDFGNDRPPRRDFGGDRGDRGPRPGGFNSDRGSRDFGGDRPSFPRKRHHDDG